MLPLLLGLRLRRNRRLLHQRRLLCLQRWRWCGRWLRFGRSAARVEGFGELVDVGLEAAEFGRRGFAVGDDAH